MASDPVCDGRRLVVVIDGYGLGLDGRYWVVSVPDVNTGIGVAESRMKIRRGDPDYTREGLADRGAEGRYIYRSGELTERFDTRAVRIRCRFQYRRRKRHRHRQYPSQLRNLVVDPELEYPRRACV